MSEGPRPGSARRATIGRAAWGIGDQALSSLTNFGLAIAVARQVDTAGFGAFSIAFAVYLVALTLTRAIAIDPLVIRFSRAAIERWRPATQAATGTALVLGVAIGAVIVVVGSVLGGAVGPALMALGVALPALLVQDAWRYAFFAAGRGRSAFVNDLVWAAVLAGAFVLMAALGVQAVGVLILAWATGALAGALAGAVQARVIPDPRRARGWWRDHRDLAQPLAIEGLVLSGAQPITLAVIGAVTGLVVVGTIRAGQVLMNGIHVATYGIQLFGVPEAVRVLQRSTGAMLRLCVLLAAGLMLVAAAWGTFLMLIPDAFGTALMKANWEPAQSVLLPMTVMTVASGAQGGALIGLRALAAPRRSLMARIVTSAAISAGGLVGALTGGAVGGAWGMAIGLVVGAVVWWRQLLTAAPEYRRHPDDAGRSVSPARPG